MKSYSERVVFSQHAQQALHLATHLVNGLPYHEVGTPDRSCMKEIRCHELVRAVSTLLGTRGFDNAIFDGELWCIEHTWLALGSPYGFILDVYTPGRSPQVQLIDVHFAITRGYNAAKKKRKDIDTVVVERIKRDMQPALLTWRVP